MGKGISLIKAAFVKFPGYFAARLIAALRLLRRARHSARHSLQTS